MAEDGLSIAPGRGRGEAVIFPESTFDPVQFSQRAFDVYMKDRALKVAEEQKRREEAADYMSKLKNPIAKWDTDAVNFFNPRFQEFETEAAKVFRDGNGRLTPQQRFDLTSKQGENSRFVELSNQQKETYDGVFKAVNEKLTNSNRDKYDAASKEGVMIWGNPYDFKSKQIVSADGKVTTVGEELKKHGNNPIAFREANKQLLAVKPTWDFIERAGDIIKEDKVTAPSVIEVANIGGRRGTVQKRDYTDDQLYAISGNLYAENPIELSKQIGQWLSSTLDEKELQKFKVQALVKGGMIDKNGNETERAKQMDPQQKEVAVAEILSKEGAYKFLRMTHPATKTGFNEFNQPPKEPGAGKGFEDRYTVSVVPTSATGGDYRDFNKKHKTNYTAEEFGALRLKGGGGDYIAIEPKGGKADTESLQLTINGKQVRPIGYTVKDGKVLMTASESQPVPLKDEFGKDTDIMTSKYRVVTGIPVDQEIAGNVSAHYGFETFDAFKQMLDSKVAKLGNKAASQQSKPAEQGKTVPRATIKSLVGKKGYEGYTEQELIEYYKSQGYKIQ